MVLTSTRLLPLNAELVAHRLDPAGPPSAAEGCVVFFSDDLVVARDADAHMWVVICDLMMCEGQHLSELLTGSSFCKCWVMSGRDLVEVKGNLRHRIQKLGIELPDDELTPQQRQLRQARL
eukprot:3541455-Amphidinium_carterae.1